MPPLLKLLLLTALLCHVLGGRHATSLHSNAHVMVQPRQEHIDCRAKQTIPLGMRALACTTAPNRERPVCACMLVSALS